MARKIGQGDKLSKITLNSQCYGYDEKEIHIRVQKKVVLEALKERTTIQK